MIIKLSLLFIEMSCELMMVVAEKDMERMLAEVVAPALGGAEDSIAEIGWRLI